MSVERKKYVDMSDYAADFGRILVEEAAAAIESKAVARAPVDTANLRNSIERRMTGAYEAEVATNVEYAIYQEFGTRYQQGTPYMRPAVDEFRSQLAREAKKASKESYARNKR